MAKQTQRIEYTSPDGHKWFKEFTVEVHDDGTPPIETQSEAQEIPAVEEVKEEKHVVKHRKKKDDK